MNSHHHTDDHDHDPIDDMDTLSPKVVDGADDALDDALLDLLGQAIDAGDPMPAHVLAAARGAVAWRTIDQDLAGLVFDSATELTGVRDPNVARQLTFRSDGVEIEVMLVDSNARRLVGQLVPARPTTVTLAQVLIPVQAVVIGALALGEQVTARMLAGALLVFAAVGLNAIAGPGAPEDEAEPVSTAAD